MESAEPLKAAGRLRLRTAYRRARVLYRRLMGREPFIPYRQRQALEFHGSDYGGWPIVRDSLDRSSVVVDLGLGEDISFSESLIHKYGCRVYGFDPTPKSIAYVKHRAIPNFSLVEVGIAAEGGEASFYLPNEEAYVSGSLFHVGHVGRTEIKVPLIAIERVPEMIGTGRIDLMKVDIEGAEFDLLACAGFASATRCTKQICIEFHHRWPHFGKEATLRALDQLRALGFQAAWVSASNEEVLFVRTGAFD